MQDRFNIQKSPLSPLRADPRFVQPGPGAGHVAGVAATSGGLIRSTALAGAGALAILTLFWLPAEYGIDPTGVGRLLGLTEMGAIKQQLAGEAAAQDAAAAAATAPVMAMGGPGLPADVGARLDRIDAQLAQIAVVIGADLVSPPPVAVAPVAVPMAVPVAAAPVPAPVAASVPATAETDTVVPTQPDANGWRDELVFTLAPAEAKEIKLEMAAGDIARFQWASEGGGVNYTQHGDDGGANEVRFEDGRAALGQDGTMTAPFAGNHGWFWRNRSDVPVTVTLRVGGAYARMIEVAQP